MIEGFRNLVPKALTCASCGAATYGWCTTCTSSEKPVKLSSVKMEVYMACPLCERQNVRIGRSASIKRPGYDIYAMRRHVFRSCPATRRIRAMYLHANKVKEIRGVNMKNVLPQLVTLSRNTYNARVAELRAINTKDKEFQNEWNETEEMECKKMNDLSPRLAALSRNNS